MGEPVSLVCIRLTGKYIRDLADIHSDGRLTRDGFAVAMYLIQGKLAGKDIPATLPSSLMPPSTRVPALGVSPFSPANIQSHQEPEPATDLFSFDDTPPASAPPQPLNNFGSVQAQITGSSSSAFASSKPNVDTDPFTSSHHPCASDILSNSFHSFTILIHSTSSRPTQ